MSEFFTRYQATAAEMQRYVDGLPLWVNVWRSWMFLLFTAALVFVVWKREARWLAATMVASLVATTRSRWSRAWAASPSIAFVALWSPLLVYMARRFGRLERARAFDRIYRAWVAVVVGTLSISLAFDVYNVLYSLVRGVP